MLKEGFFNAQCTMFNGGMSHRVLFRSWAKRGKKSFLVTCLVLFLRHN